MLWWSQNNFEVLLNCKSYLYLKVSRNWHFLTQSLHTCQEEKFGSTSKPPNNTVFPQIVFVRNGSAKYFKNYIKFLHFFRGLIWRIYCRGASKLIQMFPPDICGPPFKCLCNICMNGPLEKILKLCGKIKCALMKSLNPLWNILMLSYNAMDCWMSRTKYFLKKTTLREGENFQKKRGKRECIHRIYYKRIGFPLFCGF